MKAPRYAAAEREKIRKKVEAAVRLTEMSRSLHERIRRLKNER